MKILGMDVLVDDSVPDGMLILYSPGEYQTITHHEGREYGKRETVEIRPPQYVVVTGIGNTK